MAKILLIQGANMRLLGIREPDIYGKTSAEELDKLLLEHAQRRDIELEIFYTNSEAECMDRITKAYHDRVDVLVMNPGGFTYGAHAIRDTIKGVGIPYVEVHISNIYARGIQPVIAPAAKGVIMGFGPHGYILALDAAAKIIEEKKGR
jgi:3-dehydroquinate dehydratase II